METKNQNDLLQPVMYCTEDNSFYCNGELISACSYDKRQDKYIAKHVHSSYEHGFKFIYGNSPEGIRIKIEKRINKLNINENSKTKNRKLA